MCAVAEGGLKGAARDLTVLAVPAYFASIGAEYLWLRGKRPELGASPALYERRDTVASLTMGVASLVAPAVVPPLLRRITPGRGKGGRVLLASAACAVGVTTLADAAGRALRRRAERRPPSRLAARAEEAAGAVSGAGGVAAVVTAGLAAVTTWASATSYKRLASRRIVRSAGRGSLATAGAVLGWDFIYYWNHRLMHESRFMWAIHVVHHSSERYNLSTALRQPVAEAFGTFLPYSALALFGYTPRQINTARGVNLLYQFWIHTEAIGRLGPVEGWLNTPSAHRVHHGSNGRYLDRNHGSILVVWDRLFGTYEPETERAVYGLTKNIDTFRPTRIADHEYVKMLKDVARARTWRDRVGYVVRGPGWEASRRLQANGYDRPPAGMEGTLR